MPNYPGWAFYKVNPWRKRFDQVIRRVLEGGFIDHWKYSTWVQMKEKRSPEDELVFEDRSKLTSLSLDDLQGVFYLGALALGFTVTVFVAERIF